MTTIGINTSISLSTEDVRTQLESFYKSLSVSSSTIKTLTLASGGSGSLSLTQSSFLIIIGVKDSLTISLANIIGDTIEIEDAGFLMLNASNLNSVTITNGYTEEQQISLFF